MHHDRHPLLLHPVLVHAEHRRQVQVLRDLPHRSQLSEALPSSSEPDGARDSSPPAKLHAAGLSLVIDLVTLEVVRALKAVGVDSIVLKGPVLGRTLYDRAELRLYADSDLLVAPHNSEAASSALETDLRNHP